MNKADVIRKVSEETGIESNLCEKVIKAFEEQSGDVLAVKLKGKKPIKPIFRRVFRNE